MKDEEQRFLFAALAMLGGVIRHGAMQKYIAADAWAMADEMLLARDGQEGVGITAIKPKRKSRTVD